MQDDQVVVEGGAVVATEEDDCPWVTGVHLRRMSGSREQGRLTSENSGERSDSSEVGLTDGTAAAAAEGQRGHISRRCKRHSGMEESYILQYSIYIGARLRNGGLYGWYITRALRKTPF